MGARRRKFDASLTGLRVVDHVMILDGKDGKNSFNF